MRNFREHSCDLRFKLYPVGHDLVDGDLLLVGAGLGLGDEQHEVELLLPPPEAEHHVRAEAEEVVHLGQRGGLAAPVPAEVIVDTEDV